MNSAVPENMRLGRGLLKLENTTQNELEDKERKKIEM